MSITHLKWEVAWGHKTGRLGTAGHSEGSTPCPCPRSGRQGMWAVGWYRGPLGCCLVLLWCCRWGWAACKATMWWALQWSSQRGTLQGQQRMFVPS